MIAAWRPLTVGDVCHLIRIADEVHPDLPEREQVFAERIQLFPAGCLALVDDGGELCGYAISHPINQHSPPALDSLLGRLAPSADQYYIHDLAILPSHRGRGLAAQCVMQLFEVAKPFATICLVSVYGTAGFWGRLGFIAEPVEEALSEKIAAYGQDALYMVRKTTLSTTDYKLLNPLA
jgi:GNAT superfamily N-acetyltransferase